MNASKRKPAAVLFMTHVWNDLMRSRFERLRREAGKAADCYILMEKSPAVDLVVADGPELARHMVVFDKSTLPRQLGHPYAFHNKLVPGSTHFPVIAFILRFRYDRTFLIENDVEFSGNWGDFVASVLADRPDFASMHISGYRPGTGWGWWDRVYIALEDESWARKKTCLMRSFNVAYCLSLRAAELVQAAHRRGWRGHHEVVISTILAHHGCKIVDLSRDGGFCRPGAQQLAPGLTEDDLSSVRWRPSVTEEEFSGSAQRGTLFHPVKDKWHFDGERVVRFDQDV